MNFSQEFEQALTQSASLEKFTSLLKKISNYNYVLQGEEPDSLIHLAVVNDRLDVVKLLVQQGASLEPLEIRPKSENPHPEFEVFGFDDDERFTGDPLLSAAATGKQEIFEFLAPLASISQRRQAMLYLADGLKSNSLSYSEDNTSFQQLINSKPSTDNPDSFGQWLHDLAQSTITEPSLNDTIRSASLKFIERCQAQILQGLNINRIGDHGCTLLWTASNNGYLEAVQTLLQLGATPDIPNQTDGWTPLMIAVDAHIPWLCGTKSIWGTAKSQQVNIVRLLLEAGANVNFAGKNGETALYLLHSFDREEIFDEEIDLAICEMESVLRDAGAK
ncbi:ankyrin repeat domain-containing protein [Nostoc sp. FACHB-87]|uniref:ankyrin repeat domain-containing protein n=1 Tax=Nostocaceae TaxID=1162 RepID=UPI001685A7EE|nr:MULTISPECIES: ankyrin repeat domain-containing protein [Nostocaceae]MBD2300295.1 ankyrin repeat domain-containing protein [Nostoc sp. FACHB-190]MBD2455009.1 ankyrin repeat domain-containing protein [Nostoc sp. FACHB-87]MBD2474670.1 ankyrin repeat domain-containing protein [Anabaena sp. FACHB-83]